MVSHVNRVRWSAAAVLGLLAACGGGGSSETPTPPPPPTPTATLSIAPASGTVVAGNSVTTTVTVTRGGGFTGAVTIGATGAPAGVTVTGGTIAEGASTQAVTISASAEAATGAADLAITGTASGVTIAPVGYALTVEAPPVPTATLSIAPASGTVVAGNSVTTTVTVTRGGGFTGAVTIGATGAPAGVTVTGGTIAEGASTQAVTISASAEAAMGAADLAITGTASGVTIAPVGYALTIDPAPGPGTVASVTVSVPAGALLVENTEVPLVVTLFDAAGDVLWGLPVAWTSSATHLATVSDSGLARGVTPGGPVTFTAESGGVSGSITLTVIKDVTAFVEAVRSSRGLPALGGAVVTRDGGIVAIGVSGNRRAGGPAVTLQDQWHIGSNLKGITAMLAAIAVDEGLISWDAKVVDSFPEFASQIRAEYEDTTLRDLLAMRAGLEGNPPGNDYSAGGSTAKGQREWGARRALGQAPVVAPGTYFYSNLSYVTAGAMIERAFGGTYEDLIASRIGDPLGADRIGWGPQTLSGQSNNPVPHTWSGGWNPCEACDNPPGLSAAGRSHMPLGSWALIIGELLKADAAVSPLLGQDEARALFTGVTAIPGAGTDQYGLGWITTTRPWGGRTVTHSGSNNSNHSVTWLGLDTGVAFLALTNASGGPAGNTTGAALEELIVRLLTWQQTGN